MKDVSTLINRYSSSLYSIAKGMAVAEEVYAGMLKLTDCIALMEDYGKLALSSQVPKRIKSQIWQVVLDVAKSSDSLKSFINLLLDNGRINLLPKIVIRYHNLLLVDQEIKPVQVYTSFKLTAAEHKALIKQLEKIYDQKIDLQAHIDQDLIGGMVLKVDSFMLDASIKSKLSNIKQTLLS